MDERSRRKTLEILRVLAESPRPLGGTRIAQALRLAGRDISQRTIRYYLGLTDAEGLTEAMGRRGRRLTNRGRQELANSFAVDKVGFVAAKVDALTCQMDFRLRQARGEVVVNLSTIDSSQAKEARRLMARVYRAGYSMGERLHLVPPGGALGRFRVGQGEVGVATICSVSVNGVLLAAGIPTHNRFGGLVQVAGHRPMRFTQLIAYDGTTIDPLEIFIKGQMTSVNSAAAVGDGMIGASFREIPAVAADQARRLMTRMQKAGLGGILLIGRPGQPLLEVPVPPGRVGLVVVGGLNPLAAVEEAGLATQNQAMGMLYPFEDLQPFEKALA